MGAYEDFILTTTPAFHYELGETTGNFLDSTARHDLNAEAGVLTRGVTSLLPGAPAEFCISQVKDTPMCSRANNAIYDAAGDPFRTLGLGVWFEQNELQQVAPLIRKWDSYGLMLADSLVRMYCAGSGDIELDTPGDYFVPNNRYFVVGLKDGPAGLWRIWVNGGLVVEQAIPNEVIENSAGEFHVGGWDEFGSFGFHGKVEKVTVWHSSADLDEDAIRTAYELGVTDVAEEAGLAANVFPWSKLVLTADFTRRHLTLANDSQSSIYVALDIEASAHAGIRIPPGGYRDIDGYTGPIAAIHDAAEFGAKRLLISARGE